MNTSQLDRGADDLQLAAYSTSLRRQSGKRGCATNTSAYIDAARLRHTMAISQNAIARAIAARSQEADVDAVRFKGARHAARIDQQVGDRIRKRRTLLGFTQEQLAEALDISYQQIQKYETGANRVSAGRLFQIAQRLEVPINFFFEDLGIDFSQDGDGLGGGRATFDLVRNFAAINDTGVRNAVSALLKSLASSAATEADPFDALGDLSRARRANGNGGDGDGHVD